MSEMELLGKRGIMPDEVTVIRNLINDCTVIRLTDEIKNLTIALKQQYALKIPDAIIAATALYFELPLITADTDFKSVKDIHLVLLDPSNY
jgi:predicted nucleic acid-binding protein